MQQRGNGSEGRGWRRLSLPLVLLASALLGWRNALNVGRYSVNVLYLDQWDFFTPLFEGKGFPTAFLWQVGPVRHGLGYLVNKYVAELTGWDTRAESFVILGLVFAAMLVALYLKTRLLGPVTLTDVAIPLMFLAPVLTGLYTIVPNPAHGALPLLLAMLYCVAWTFRGPLAYAAVVALNVLLIFTGFGLFMGVITPAVLALEVYRAARGGGRGRWRVPAAALALALLSLAVFFVDYKLNPAVDCFRFPDEQPLRYVWYTGLMFAGYLRVGGHGLLPSVAGVGLTLLLVGVLAYHVTLLLRDAAPEKYASLVITILIGFSLIFCLNTAVGRVCRGVDSAQAARYMPYLVPAFLGLYFQLLSLGRARRLMRFAPHLCAAVLAVMSLPLGAAGVASLEEYRRGKSEWKRCYLERENVEECNRAARFEIYPPGENRHLREKLSYLKQHKLNLYADE